VLRAAIPPPDEFLFFTAGAVQSPLGGAVLLVVGWMKD
jgi:hypothetical protein